MAESHEFDVVVIGAGPVGENVADYAHQGGLNVAIVEAERVGGECSYWACIPSKALLRPVRAVDAARAVDGAKQVVEGHANPVASFKRRDEFVSNYDDSSQVDWVNNTGLTLFRGQGRLAGERRVVVDDAHEPVELNARIAVVVCTGTRAFIPPIDGLARARPWTSREATSMTAAPRHLAIIGGGVVACEMALAAAGLGSEQVTMLVREDRVLMNTEPFASELVLQGMRARGIHVRFGTSATAVERTSAGAVTMSLDDGETLEADEVLVATGRRPRTEGLGLETVGLKPGDTLTTDDTLAVTNVNTREDDQVWLYAAGDVNGRAPLTHHGKYQARLLGDRLAARAKAGDSSAWGPFTPTADTDAFVQVIFTDPQVAMVGPTVSEAKERGVPVEVVEYDLGAVAGASLHADGYAGRVSMLIDAEREVVIGVTLVGPDVGEMVHAATIAVVGQVRLDRLWHAVPAFPTMSEVWLRLSEEWRKR